jgi:DNA ligase 1
MKFLKFAQFLNQLEKTSSRLNMTRQLAELFQELSQEEISPASYLMQGELVPKFKSLEFNLSTKLTIEALAVLMTELEGTSADQLPKANLFNEKDLSLLKNQVEKKYKKSGDLGLVAEAILDAATYEPSKLAINQVYERLVEIAQEGGEGSQQRKIDQTVQLLTKLTPNSARYVARIIIGKLRLGFSTMTMIDALSWARHQDKSDRKKLEQAYNKKADFGQLAQGYLAADSLEKAEQFLDNYEVEAGVPVMPALCQRLNTAQEIVDKMGQVIAEPKYDGLRAQIHFDLNNKQEQYQVFTRNLDNVSHMFPELKQAAENLSCQSCILDSEAIAYDEKTNELLSFQQTITRRRKHGIKNQAAEIPIKFYVFDVLSLDGESLVDLPLTKRKQKLKNLLRKESEWQVLEATDYIVTKDPLELRQYHQDQLTQGLEGAVIKQTEAPYRGGRKGWRWVKIKETEGQTGKLNDTLDLVVMGYYRGKGKRTQFGIGAFLVGVLAENSQIKTLAKIGTGLTDKQFRKIKRLADQHKLKKSPANYDVPKELKPDVWIAPGLVVEIAADELTDSPLHSAGQALRFPRLVKLRQDKDWQQATTLQELEQIEVG